MNRSPNIDQSPNDEDFVVVDDHDVAITDVLTARSLGQITDKEAVDSIVQIMADYLSDLTRDEPVVEQVWRCPACGDTADHCLGHGEMADPYGRLVLDKHDAGDHSACVINCERES